MLSFDEKRLSLSDNLVLDNLIFDGNVGKPKEFALKIILKFELNYVLSPLNEYKKRNIKKILTVNDVIMTS